jgi:hypothetical protein
MRKFEQRIEGLLNGTFARIFASDIQPVEIVAALQRECDNNTRIESRERIVAPNVYVVEVSSHDYERLNPYGPQLDQEFARAVLEYARAQRYAMVGPLQVSLEEDNDLGTGRYRVSCNIQASHPSRPRSVPTSAGHWLEIQGQPPTGLGPVTIIGRGSEADIRVNDPGVSRKHAEIRIGQPPMLLDLGSTNGLIMDGRPTRRASLRDGSLITLGSTFIVYRQAV